MAEAETASVASEGRARWSWLAALGLTLAAFGPLLMLVGSVLWGLEIGDEMPFFSITTIIGLVGAFLVLRFGTWAKVLGIVAGVLVAGALFWTIFGLFTPNSFFDFMPGLLVIPGAILAIVSCIAAIVATRRGSRSVTPERGERRGVRLVLGVVVALGVISAGLTFGSRSTVDDAGAAEMTVAMKDFEFDAESYDVTGGTSVLARNDDPFMHTFSVDELDIDEVITPGSEVLIKIPDEAGVYVLYCRPHTFDPKNPEDDDMAAELSVR